MRLDASLLLLLSGVEKERNRFTERMFLQVDDTAYREFSELY